MGGKPRVQDRRSSVRHNLVYPVIYTRFDNQGRPFDTRPSRSMNVSLGGVRLQSDFPVNPREVLDIAIALEDSVVSYKGEVIYVLPSHGQGFQLGISIKEIENEDRIALTRLRAPARDSRFFDRDNLIVSMGQILCPNCGTQIASVAKIRDMIDYCTEFLGQCRCGEMYSIRIASFGSASLSFPDKQIELIC